jgi:hypothetical protein
MVSMLRNKKIREKFFICVCVCVCFYVLSCFVCMFVVVSFVKEMLLF